jgi:hypothetical protein
MPTSDYKGTTTVLSKRTVKTSNDGKQVTLVYTGTKTALEAIEPAVGSAPSGYTDVYVRATTIETAKAGKLCELTIESDNFIGASASTFSPDEVLECQFAKIEKDIRLHPIYASGGIKALTESDRNSIAEWEADTNKTTKATKYADLSDNATHLADRIARGQTGFDVYIPVATRTRYSGTTPIIGGCGKQDSPYVGIGAPMFSANAKPYVYIKTADSKVRQSRRWQRREEWTGFEQVDTDIVNNT